MYDYKWVDSCAFLMSGLTGINVAFLRTRASALATTITSVLLTVMLFALCYTTKDEVFEYYATSKMIDTCDLDLLEAGQKYLDKRIRLEKLLGRDVELLNRQRDKIKSTCESLRERGLKPKDEDPEMNEEMKEKMQKNLTERYKPSRSKSLI